MFNGDGLYNEIFKGEKAPITKDGLWFTYLFLSPGEYYELGYLHGLHDAIGVRRTSRHSSRSDLVKALYMLKASSFYRRGIKEVDDWFEVAMKTYGVKWRDVAKLRKEIVTDIRLGQHER